MLVDVTPVRVDPIGQVIAAVNEQSEEWPQRLSVGIWRWGHWNAELDVSDSFKDQYKGFFGREGDWSTYVSPYGVCDSLLDVPEHPSYKSLLADPTRRFTIIGVEVRKDHQPSSGGWRWHKWGEYIGKHEPQHEYLFYEENIESVWTFHVYEHA